MNFDGISDLILKNPNLMAKKSFKRKRMQDLKNLNKIKLKIG